MALRDGLAQGLDGHTRADVELAALTLDMLQVGDAAEEGHGRELPQHLGDPEADIGGAGDQRGLGVLQIRR